MAIHALHLLLLPVLSQDVLHALSLTGLDGLAVDQVEHHAAHERILETLTTSGRVESGNEMPVDLLDG
jgi:hypothetical protein